MYNVFWVRNGGPVHAVTRFFNYPWNILQLGQYETFVMHVYRRA
jgi:hypothetical protein